MHCKEWDQMAGLRGSFQLKPFCGSEPETQQSIESAVNDSNTSAQRHCECIHARVAQRYFPLRLPCACWTMYLSGAALYTNYCCNHIGFHLRPTLFITALSSRLYTASSLGRQPGLCTAAVMRAAQRGCGRRKLTAASAAFPLPGAPTTAV